MLNLITTTSNNESQRLLRYFRLVTCAESEAQRDSAFSGIAVVTGDM